MIKRTFKYCPTHKEDEKYMQEMCSKGWAAKRLVEGFWTFESCKPNQYVYRVFYARNINKKALEKIKSSFAQKGIEFVSQYSFWLLFRSTKPFEIYTEEQEIKICKRIYAPMPIGAVISWIFFGIGMYATYKFHILFIIPAILIVLYASMCTWLAISYHKLINKK